MILSLVNDGRKGWVDALRGLAILLVMYGHSVKGLPVFFVFTSPVKMPLFFAITGYVFSVKEWRMFLSQLFRKVIVPWIILGMLPSLVTIPFHGFVPTVDRLLNMISGKELWFFPCFIIGEVIHYIIRRYCNKDIWIVAASFVCLVIGLILHRYNYLDYAMFNRALVVQPFFLIGYLFRQFERQLTGLKWHKVIIAAIAYIGLCFLSKAVFHGQTIDVHMNRYINVPYSLTLIFLGCFTLFIAASKAGFRSWAMSFIGQNTLVLYIWHGIAISLLVKAASVAGWVMPFNWWAALIKVLWACVVCGVAAIILNKYFPFAVGKRKSK